MERGLPELAPAPCSHDGSFVIVGSGPSLPDHIEDLKREQLAGRPLCAIKGSHDLLIDHGITPNLFVSVEPRKRPLKHLSENTIYLLASRCSPDLFDQLKDYKVLIWHAWSEEAECDEFKGQFAIGGGSTSGIRAIFVGYVLGFRKFILYGMDSCLAGDKKTKRFSGETVGDGWITDIIVGGRRFWCNGAMAQQAIEFQHIYTSLPDINIYPKGDGLITAIINERKKRGFTA